VTDHTPWSTAAPLPRSEVYHTSPVHHGGLDYAELEVLQLAPEDVIDFSVNSNPFGPSPRVHQALANIALDRYPDREAVALRRALAERLQVTPEHIVIGNGAAELFWLIALAYLSRGDNVLVLSPSFGEYARVAHILGAQVHHWIARAEDGFAIAEGEIARLLEQLRPRLVFICNPNNPTGTVLPPEILEKWCAPHPDVLFIVDESYHAFAIGFQSVLPLRRENILVVRSMTKDYALAALRLGYAVGAIEVIEAIKCVRPAWNVNALAQAAGLAALSDEDHVHRSIKALHHMRRRLQEGMRELGWKPLPSAVHFFLVPVGDGAAFRNMLLMRGILVRNCASFGLPSYVRIAPRLPEENARLLAALQEITPALLEKQEKMNAQCFMGQSGSVASKSTVNKKATDESK